METQSAIEKALQRERVRRKLAEQLLEKKSRELFSFYEDLELAHLDLQKNQRQLVHSEKMASIGILVAGIAHEINNPVGYVQSNIHTLKEYLPVFLRLSDYLEKFLELAPGGEEFSQLKDEVSRYLKETDLSYISADSLSLIDESLDGLTRIGEIVKGLRTFAHTGGFEHALLDVNNCLRSIYALVNGQTKGGCQITMDLQPVPKVMASETKLGQVFLNLLVNATQAIEHEEGHIFLRSYESNSNVVIEVEDNGSGISEENMGKLFTPFFTTKPVGEGTGLGLSISFGIMQELQGNLDVSSELGRGTTFKVLLPVA